MVTAQTPGGVQLNLMSVFYHGSVHKRYDSKEEQLPPTRGTVTRYVNTSQRLTASSPTDKNVKNVRGKLLALSELQQAHHCDDHPMHHMLSKTAALQCLVRRIQAKKEASAYPGCRAGTREAEQAEQATKWPLCRSFGIFCLIEARPECFLITNWRK